MNIFENPKAFATPLLLQAFDIYGMDLFTLEENVSVDDLKKRFPQTNDTIINRMMAGAGLYSSNLFFQDPIVFGQTCRSFNRHKYLYVDAPDMKDICWGVSEATLIVSPEDDKNIEPFSEAVIKYIRYMAKYHGIITNIPSLPFINLEDTKTSDVYDPVIDAGALQTSIDTVSNIEQYVQTNMVQCLNQISGLSIDMAEDAKAQLSSILRGE
jgi:hypothetical protein